MKLAITRSKLLLGQEQAVIHQGQSVEDIELCFLRKNESIVHQFVETGFECISRWVGDESYFGGVVVEVGCSDVFVFGVVDHAGFKVVEGEEVG